MEVREVIPRGSYIDASFCRTVHLVSFLISAGISAASKSLFFLQDRSSIFVLFNLTPNCFWQKFDQSHLLVIFPPRLGRSNTTYEV